MVKLLIRLSGEKSEILKWVAIIAIIICVLTTPLSTLQHFVWRYIMKEHPADTKLVEDIVRDLPEHAVTIPIPDDLSIQPPTKRGNDDKVN